MARSSEWAGRLLVFLFLVWHPLPALALSAQQAAASPKKITHVDPIYPELARQARVQGIVMVQITLGSDGRVSQARVIRSVPMLDQAALDAVRQWQYDAGELKAPLKLVVSVPFSLAGAGATAPITRPQSVSPEQPAAVPRVATAQAPTSMRTDGGREGTAQAPAQTQPTTTPSRSAAGELGPASLSVKGLNYETELTGLYLGDFAHARLERVSVDFGFLLGSYLSAFARRCNAYLPANKIEMTRSECAREQYWVNGYGVRTGPSTCIEYREVGTGLYADPQLYAAHKRIDAELSRSMVRETFRGMAGNNPMGTAMRTIDAARSVGDDMDSLLQTNGCSSAALERFQDNLLRFALGKPALTLPGGETLASSAPKKSRGGTFEDSNYTRLLDDLIADNARGWMLNRFVQGSVSGVTVSSRDALGRPSKIVGNYLFEGVNGRSRGSVTVQFSDGLPQCIFFFDNPATCRTPSRRIITKYENGGYQKQ